jgi:uncharacterized protein (TIGR02145 family)
MFISEGNMKRQNRLTNIIKVILLLCLSSILLGDTSQWEISLENETGPIDVDDITLATVTVYYGRGIIDCPDTLIIENINLRVKRGFPFGRYGPYGSTAFRSVRLLLTDTDTLLSHCGLIELYWKKGTTLYPTTIDSVSLGRLIDILRAFENSSASCVWEKREMHRLGFPVLKTNTNTTIKMDTNISTEIIPSITNINSFKAVTIGNTTRLKLPTDALPETDTNAIVATSVNISTEIVTAMTNVGPLEVVTIGGKTWLKRNLNIATDSSWCFRRNPDICARYGRLYNWNAAVKACDALGDGWRLPDTADWNVLIEVAGGREIAGTKLKSNTNWHLDSRGNTPVGTDTFGFSALPGGWCNVHDNCGYVGDYGFWWSATKMADRPFRAYLQLMGFYSESVGLGNSYNIRGLSVRCMRD